MYLDRRLLRMALKEWQRLLAAVGLGILAAGFAIGQAALLSFIISAVFLDSASLEEVLTPLYALLAAVVLRALSLWGSEVCANSLAVRIKERLRATLLERLITLGPAYLKEERTGELSNLLTNGVEALDAYFSQYLPALALGVLIPATFLFFVFPVDTVSGVILLVTAPLIPVFMQLIGSQARQLTQRQWRGLSRMSAFLLDVLRGLPALKLLGRSAEQGENIARVSERYRQATMRVLRVAFLSALVLEMVATISTAVVAVEVGLRLLYGHLQFQPAFFVLLLAPEFYLPLRSLGARFHAAMSGETAARRIYQVLEGSSPQIFDTPRLFSDSGEQKTALTREVEFKRVSFQYPQTRGGVHQVQLEIPAGTRTALVGPNGAGKSTLASLLLGFIQPQEGEILVDGQPLTTLSLHAWHGNVAWVSQRPFIFKGTILENILFARPEASMEEVYRAADNARAHDFILDLPDGYQTVVGERGARLSAGQAQRIALARAFLKDASLLILDEPSANLDPESAEAITNAIYRLVESRTVVMIAHRLSTVQYADKVVVLNGGKVIAQGTHAQLLQGCELYRQMLGLERWHPSPEPLSSQPSAERLESLSDKAILQPIEPSFSHPEENIQDERGLSEWMTLFRLSRLAAPFFSWMALSILLGFATIGSSMGLMTTSAFIISAAALHPSIAELQVAIVGVRFFGLGRGIFRYLERLVSHQVTFRLLARLRTWFYRALEPLVPARLLAYRSGDLLQRIMGDIESLEGFFSRALAPPWVAGLVGVATWLVLRAFDTRLAWVSLLFSLISSATVVFLSWITNRRLARQIVSQRAELNASIVECIQGMDHLMVYAGGAHRFKRIFALNRALEKSNLKAGMLLSVQSALIQALSGMGVWLGLWIAIPLVAGGEIDGVYLAVLLMAIMTGFEALPPLAPAAGHLSGNIRAARRLFEVVDAEPVVSSPETPEPLPASFSLEFRDVSFRYPTYGEGVDIQRVSPLALSGVSFELPAGGKLALVGPSGSGKSTLLNLILRVWDLKEGEILLGGQPLGVYSPDALRKAAGVLAQDTYLFNASVRDNLLIARPEARDDEIVAAAKQAEIHTFILSLPQGYDTWIGEEGLSLSGGERQRLALARALLKDPPLLILDEPTTNLDPIVEREILHTILARLGRRTTLLATHRLIGMEKMDQIIVLHNGEVVQHGDHQTLLNQPGLYRKMWDIQQGILLE